jgi:restriction endonuclease S subunit
MGFYQAINGIPDYFFICLLNSHLVATYVNYFINNTQTFGIDDARQIPIIIPSKELLKDFKEIFDGAIATKKKQSANKISLEKAENALSILQEKLDKIVDELYQIV